MINIITPKNRIDFYLLFIINFIKGFLFSLKNVKYQHDGIVIYFPYNLVPLSQRALFYDKKYEAEEYYLVNKYISNSDIVLELGGCLGFISIAINKKLEKPKNHIVLEPNYNLKIFLEKNKDNNKCGFIIESKVISKAPFKYLYFNNTILGSSLKIKSKNFVKVQGVTIKDLEKKYKLRFNTLVIDIEGGELELFKEMNFKEYDFKKIIVEFHDFANILSSDEVIMLKGKLAEEGYLLEEKISHTEIYLKK